MRFGWCDKARRQLPASFVCFLLTHYTGGFFFSLLVVVQLLSHVQLSEPMDCSTQGFPVLYYLLDFAQTHVHLVNDTIQPSHPLLPAYLPAFRLSQHQGLDGKESASKSW